jgi:hypothetical protein
MNTRHIPVGRAVALDGLLIGTGQLSFCAITAIVSLDEYIYYSLLNEYFRL